MIIIKKELQEDINLCSPFLRSNNVRMGLYIKHLREQIKLTQEELGKMLDPPVNKAAVNKWETGRVENIKRTHIIQLSNIFNVKPEELMCFDEKMLAEEVKTIELVKKHFGEDAVKLIEYYQSLDNKEEWFKMVQDGYR